MKRRSFVSAALGLGLGALLLEDAAAAPKKRRPVPARKPAKKSLGQAAPEKITPRPPANADKPLPADDAESRDAPQPWRHYELTTSIAAEAGKGPLRVWLPLPLQPDSPWQRTGDLSWAGNADLSAILGEAEGELRVFFAEWRDPARVPQMQLTCAMATRERQFDITRRNPQAERSELLRHFLRASPRLPTDGLVRSSAERIVGRIKDPVAQGKAIYDWVVDNTRFDRQGSGCGRGDIGQLIERPETPGRCADINGLFVSLARAVGLPARLTFGQRVDQSLIVASLGQRGELAGAEHCRAEFYAAGYGWIPVDPADVRKALAEDGNVLDGMKSTVLRKLLFGFWEPNWIAYNRIQDVALRHAHGPQLASFATPYAEIGDGPAGGAVRIAVSARRGPDATP